MKRITLILSLILSILFPIQAQDYIYKKDAEPIKTTFDRLYLKETDNNYYITENAEFEFDTIAGVFRVCAANVFSGVQDEWTLTVTRDEVDENKIWLQPIITVNGLGADDVKPVYAWVDTVAGNIQLPYGQTIYGGPNEFMNLVIAGYDGEPVLTGAAVCNYVLDGTSVSFTIPFLGAGDTVNNAWWYGAFENMTITWTDVLISEPESVIPLTEIDSISKVAPKIRLLDYERSQYSSELNLLFNYNLLTPRRQIDEEFVTQAWFNETISYKAYDSDNNIVKEDYIDVFDILDNNVRIMMTALDWDGESDFASYDIDGFLPCDTALQVAFTISPEALVWAGDTKIAYEGIESYVDEQGQPHGIVIDYYNARPRLLSTSPLSFNPTNPYEAYLQFSEPVTRMSYSEQTLSVYRKDGNSGKYSMINTTTDYYMFPDFAETATIQVPDYQTLQDGDIVTVSWDNWRVCDWDFCRAEPFSMESGIDAEGNPYGLWWMVENIPYIVDRDWGAFPKQISYIFSTEIVRTYDMGEIGYSLIYCGTDYTIREEIASGVITNTYVSGNVLTLDLPDLKFPEEGEYMLEITFADGAVTDFNDKPMQAVTDGSNFGVSAPSIESRRKTLSYNRDDKTIKVKFDVPIFRTDDMPSVTFDVFNENREMYASGEFIARAEDRTLYLTLPENVVLNENEKSTILLYFPKGAVEGEYGTQMLPVDCCWGDNGKPTGYYAVVDMTADTPGTETSFFHEGAYLFNLITTDSQEAGVPVDFSLIANDVELRGLGINSATQWSLSGFLSGLYGDIATETPFPAYSYWNNNGAEEIVMLDYNDAYGGACVGTIDALGDGRQLPVYIVEVDNSSVRLVCSFTVDGDEAVFTGVGSPYLIVIADDNLYGLLEFEELSITQSGEFKAAKVKAFDKPMKLDATIAPLELGALKK